ncbi:MAG: dockerin type I repeat-containing protein [Planctomycetes bacterium]|nr:dockerin type I repeat-containing protein [Planctomycetota bacterium]
MPVAVTAQTVIAWDHPGTDVAGGWETVLQAEVALAHAGLSPAAGGAPLASVFVVCPGPGEVSLEGLLGGRAEGIYDICCRVMDRAGNWSDWSDTLTVEFDSPECVDTDGDGRLDECGGERVFIRGDVNRDSRVDVSDAVRLLDYLFWLEHIMCLVACDANDDNRVDVADPVYLLSYFFLGGREPAHPFPSPGLDSLTPGRLSCEH